MGANSKKAEKNKLLLDLKLSPNYLRVLRDFVHTEKAKANIADAYIQKRKKTYGEIHSDMYSYSKKGSKFCHVISFFLALSFATTAIGAIFWAAGFTSPLFINYFIAGIILIFLEQGQHKSLNALFSIYYADKEEIPTGFAIFTAMFSIISIVSSGFSCYFLMQNLNPIFLYTFVIFSIINELGIVSLCNYQHNYQYMTEKEAMMINDLIDGYNGFARLETNETNSQRALEFNENSAPSEAGKAEGQQL